MKKILFAFPALFLMAIGFASAGPMAFPQMLAALQSSREKGVVFAFDNHKPAAEVTADLLYAGAVRHALAGYQIVVFTKSAKDWTAHEVQGCDGVEACVAQQMPLLSVATAGNLRDAGSLKGATVLVFRRGSPHPVGMADGFDSLREALQFATELHSASSSAPAVNLLAIDMSEK